MKNFLVFCCFAISLVDSQDLSQWVNNLPNILGQQSYNNLEQQIRELGRSILRLDELASRVDQLERGGGNDRKIRELESKVDQLVDKNQKLEQSIKNVQSRRNNIPSKSEVNNLKTKVSSFESKTNDLTVSLQKTENALANLLKLYESQSVLIDDLVSYKNNQNSIVGQLSSNLSKFKEETEKSLDQRKVAFGTFRLKVENLERQNINLTANFHELRKICLSSNQQWTEKWQKLSEREAELHNENEKVNMKISNVEKSLQEEQEKLQSLEKGNNNVLDSIQFINRGIEQLNQTILHGEIKNVKNELEAVKEEGKKNRVESENAFSVLEKENTNLSNLLLETKSALEKLKNDFKDKPATISQLVNDSSKHNELINELFQSNEKLQIENNNILGNVTLTKKLVQENQVLIQELNDGKEKLSEISKLVTANIEQLNQTVLNNDAQYSKTHANLFTHLQQVNASFESKHLQLRATNKENVEKFQHTIDDMKTDFESKTDTIWGSVNKIITLFSCIVQTVKFVVGNLEHE